jgi:hypothetical protein
LKKEIEPSDGTIIVKVIELEGPSELFLEVSTRGDRKRANELLEVDGAILVDIEDIKDIIGKVCWITKGEELLVNLLKLILCQVSRGAV